MQALGAFAFLSSVKGKLWFRKHIPAALAHLASAVKKRNDFPCLQALVERIIRTVFPVESVREPGDLL
jgi:aminoglycoside/choline kinase family phosphotransferase